jgi:hypothetical protein
MNPSKVDRTRVSVLTDLPNIGKACADDLRLLGIFEPGQLVGQNPFEMYARLCELTATRHDPCLLDVFISITRFMAGEEPGPWWAYTKERKQLLMQSDSSPHHFEAAKTATKSVI